MSLAAHERRALSELDRQFEPGPDKATEPAPGGLLPVYAVRDGHRLHHAAPDGNRASGAREPARAVRRARHRRTWPP